MKIYISFVKCKLLLRIILLGVGIYLFSTPNQLYTICSGKTNHIMEKDIMINYINHIIVVHFLLNIYTLIKIQFSYVISIKMIKNS